MKKQTKKEKLSLSRRAIFILSLYSVQNTHPFSLILGQIYTDLYRERDREKGLLL